MDDQLLDYMNMININIPTIENEIDSSSSIVENLKNDKINEYLNDVNTYIDYLRKFINDILLYENEPLDDTLVSNRLDELQTEYSNAQEDLQHYQELIMQAKEYRDKQQELLSELYRKSTLDNLDKGIEVINHKLFVNDYELKYLSNIKTLLTAYIDLMNLYIPYFQNKFNVMY